VTRFRPRMGLGPRLIGWVAAYALVLHAVLAGVVATELAARGAGTSGFELCLTGPDGGALPGHSQSQHENCAIHCTTIAGNAAALASAAVPLLFPSLAERPVVYFPWIASVDLLRRDGLGSRAPPTV
jgi:hypothetical protein